MSCNRIFNALCVSLLIAAAFAGFGPDRAWALETERVVLVVIDGLRYTEGLGDASETYTPHMHALADAGAIVEPFLNDGITYTSRAIPAIWCGAWTEIDQFDDPACGGIEEGPLRHRADGV